MATIGTAFLSEMHVGGRSGSDLIGRGLDPAVPIIPSSFAQLVTCVYTDVPLCLQTDFCGLITGNPIREHRCPPCWAPLLRSPLLR
jgi:hypothetical protein